MEEGLLFGMTGTERIGWLPKAISFGSEAGVVELKGVWAVGVLAGSVWDVGVGGQGAGLAGTGCDIGVGGQGFWLVETDFCEWIGVEGHGFGVADFWEADGVDESGFGNDWEEVGVTCPIASIGCSEICKVLSLSRVECSLLLTEDMLLCARSCKLINEPSFLMKGIEKWGPSEPTGTCFDQRTHPPLVEYFSILKPPSVFIFRYWKFHFFFLDTLLLIGQRFSLLSF
jgi:hypothetical protein